MAELHVDHVSTSLGGRPVLCDVEFRVADGEFAALLGPSGSGKTTILRTIAGFLDPDEGRVTVDGVDLAGRPVHRRNMGIVFQSYALFPHLSVRGNVAFGLKMRGAKRADADAAVREVLELVDITELAARKPDELSGGQQQRVALARALVIRPTLLLLDEPLSALDRKIRLELQGELRRVQRQTGITTIIVTHDQEEALSLADRLLVLDEGRIRQTGTPQDVYLHPEDGFVAGFLGASNLWGSVAWRALGLAAPAADVDATVAAMRPERVGLRLRSASGSPPSFADPRTIEVPATVLEVAFAGPVAKITLEGPSQVRIAVLALSPAVAGIDQGDHVIASLAARDVSWLPATPGPGESRVPDPEGVGT